MPVVGLFFFFVVFSVGVFFLEPGAFFPLFKVLYVMDVMTVSCSGNILD